MKENKTEQLKIKKKDGEKGAAMVMVLLVSSLMLTASIGLLLETSLNAANVTDVTAEQQAYNAAESGIQSALNVLRGNSKYQKDTGDKIDFRKAVKLSTSNAAGDTSTEARLSRWITYDGTYNDRVPFGLTGSTAYNPRTGYAYGVTIIDPENLGNVITFETDSTVNNSSNVYRYPTTGSNYITIQFVPPTTNPATVDASNNPANVTFGSFQITKYGTGAILANDLAFEIYVEMTTPVASGTMRGYIRKGTSLTAPVASYEFISKAYVIRGSTLTLTTGDTANAKKFTSNVLNGAGISTTSITGTMTSTEPNRVMITSTGYGPRGAVKKLEAFVQKNFLDGLSAPATLTLIGPAGSGFKFDPGNSANVTYSGQDVIAPDIIIPPVGTSNDANLAIVKTALDGLDKKDGQVVGYPANVTPEMPTWLQSTLNLDTVIQNLRDVAIASNGYYAAGQSPSTFGDVNNATGITFIDGDASLSKSGGGILVCTGKLTYNGGVDFNGLIIVTGAGGFTRHGGGNGTIQGNAVVAPYNPQNLAAGFLSPKYDMSGGGNSTLTYNSSSVGNGLVAVSNFALGVAEK